MSQNMQKCNLLVLAKIVSECISGNKQQETKIHVKLYTFIQTNIFYLQVSFIQPRNEIQQQTLHLSCIDEFILIIIFDHYSWTYRTITSSLYQSIQSMGANDQCFHYRFNWRKLYCACHTRHIYSLRLSSICYSCFRLFFTNDSRKNNLV